MVMALSYNTIFLLIFTIVISGCFKGSHQQFDFGFNQFGSGFNGPRQRPFVRDNFNSQSNLNNQFWLNPGQDLVFATTTTTARPLEDSVVFINNQPVIPTMVPFIPAATTPTPQFLSCFGRCPTTSEFNPVCASNRQQYGNEAKFNCARQCGLDIQIVRRGSCEGLFPMARG